MTYRIITTKETYFTKDKEACNKILTYHNSVSYGQKPPFPVFMSEDNKKISINPQYVIAIEEHNFISVK